MPRAARILLLATFALLAALVIVDLIVPARDPALRGWPSAVDDADNDAVAKANQELRLAIEHQDPAGVRRAIGRGADPDHLDPQNWSPLTHAAAVGDVAICEELLAHGAAPDGGADAAGFPSIICAATQDNVAIIDLLVRHGADVNARSPNGTTALNIATSLNFLDASVALIRGGADVNAADVNGWTPLMGVAAHAEGGPLMEVLLAAGARVDARDDAGDTALMIATRGGNRHAVSLLLHRRPSDHAVRRRNHLLGMIPASAGSRGPC